MYGTNIAKNDISIHAPREGGDAHHFRQDDNAGISIHAPREGGDRVHGSNAAHGWHFNPRPPRGGRLS